MAPVRPPVRARALRSASQPVPEPVESSRSCEWGFAHGAHGVGAGIVAENADGAAGIDDDSVGNDHGAAGTADGVAGTAHGLIVGTVGSCNARWDAHWTAPGLRTQYLHKRCKQTLVPTQPAKIKNVTIKLTITYSKEIKSLSEKGSISAIRTIFHSSLLNKTKRGMIESIRLD